MKPFPLQFVSKYYNIVYQLQNGFGKKFFSKKVKKKMVDIASHAIASFLVKIGI